MTGNVETSKSRRAGTCAWLRRQDVGVALSSIFGFRFSIGNRVRKLGFDGVGRSARMGFVFCLVTCLVPANGQTPTKTAEPAADPFDVKEFQVPIDAETAAKIDEWIAELGSPEFTRRNQATHQLIQSGAKAFNKLRDAYRSTGDFEVRSGIQKIIHEAFLDVRVYTHFGFLGVSLDQGTPGPEDNPLIPQGRVAIGLSSVIPDTGAARAGLRQGDLILAVNGAPIKGMGSRATEAFREMIRTSGPEAELELHVVRGEAELSIVAKLGRAPEPSRPERRQVLSLTEQLAEAEADFPTWWVRNFGSTNDPP